MNSKTAWMLDQLARFPALRVACTEHRRAELIACGVTEDRIVVIDPDARDEDDG